MSRDASDTRLSACDEGRIEQALEMEEMTTLLNNAMVAAAWVARAPWGRGIGASCGPVTCDLEWGSDIKVGDIVVFEGNLAKKIVTEGIPPVGVIGKTTVGVITKILPRGHAIALSFTPGHLIGESRPCPTCGHAVGQYEDEPYKRKE